MRVPRPPVLYHYFKAPVPYVETLALQEKIHAMQLRLRKAASETDADMAHAYPDVFLLLQHRPVYTAGRRQTVDEVSADLTRLTRMGADFVMSNRGGQLTYHGPGQLVGYPLWDLSRLPSGRQHIRLFVCDVLKALKRYMNNHHGITAFEHDETGVFTSPTTKLASLGMQVRHRLTSHGFAVNITHEPLPWFNQVVACGLADVHAGSVQDASSTGKQLSLEQEVPLVLNAFAEEFAHTFEPVDLVQSGELEDGIREVEELGQRMLEDGIAHSPQIQTS
ncbi:lipoyltransferase [Exidia glandulosa HHB12029]|uniref:lipoyl(octanoyl) transferase n=1 Tax=Exidia glandulosa HHB12029 TaxID=1314781 RepID=A0A165NFL2_EXIGL|nr:lipoyltransferase [Exidia glandulosa HHB12029]